ncbi:hypothetical protein [Sphingomonas sp. S2-65]|uniref:hypothetical protein n=1 Tax=Sphingomonas sp. S2-65 TaxID=2903960 RepID=UPI001F19B4EC|nr:hypothetical protein [Sphingomonas sp. S2-65]UYY58012.1 hypothetical protein LZ586_15310 [Sphingomonas sp. S2-65]
MILFDVHHRPADVVQPVAPSDPQPLSSIVDLDPLSEDLEGDAEVTMSARQLLRIVMLAAQTGKRFQRLGFTHDPVTWMLAPRRVFDRLAPIEAAQDHELFARGVMFNAVSTELDGDPEVYRDLTGSEVVGSPTVCRPATVEAKGPGLGLFTCCVDFHDGSQQAIWATMAVNEEEVRGRALRRFGEDAWDAIEVYSGFEESHPLADALVTDGVLETLCRAAQYPERVRADFEVFLDMRCVA